MGMMDGLLSSLGTNWLQGVASYRSQQATNQANVDLSHEQMGFEKEMSNTAYQRAVADMKAAGLNPMLAYSQGGASVPQYTTARVENPVAAGFNSAKTGADTMSQVQSAIQSRAQTDQIQAQTDYIRSQTVSNDVNTAKAVADVANVKAQTLSTEEGVPGVRAESQRKLDLLDAERYPGGNANSAFAADVARRKAEAAIAQSDVSRAKADSAFYEGLGKNAPYLKALLDMFRVISTARSGLSPMK